MNNIIQDIDNLSPEEREAVGRLINKYTNRKDSKPAKKRKRKKRTKETDESSDQLIVESGPGRDTPRKRIVTDESKPKQKRGSHGKGRSEPTQSYNKRNNRKRRGDGLSRRKGKGVMARTEQVQLSGDNKFLGMKEKNAERGDVKIHKQLWSGREPTQRPEEFEYIEVQCEGPCGLWFDVNPILVMKDHDTQEIKFTCNSCSRRG